MKLKRLGIIVLAFFVTSVAIAAEAPNPMVMMKSVSDQMLASLKQNRPKLKANPRLVYRLVDDILLPHVDVMGMSRSVLGRRAWTSASQGQQKEFSKAFTNVVVNTYASALNAYTNETIQFYPIRGGYQGKSRISVYSKILRNDGPPVPVSYSLALINGEWKVYDLNVEGVSLLQSFHAQFASALSQGKTVAQLTRDLQKRDKR